MNEHNHKNTPATDNCEKALIYNVTTQVAWPVYEEWLVWMLDIYIPQLLGTGCFVKHQVVRLLEVDETDGPVFAVQYYLTGKEQYDTYMARHQAGFASQEQGKWGASIFSFSSLMQVVN